MTSIRTLPKSSIGSTLKCNTYAPDDTESQVGQKKKRQPAGDEKYGREQQHHGIMAAHRGLTVAAYLQSIVLVIAPP